MNEIQTTIEKILSDEQIIDLYFERDQSAISCTDVKYGKYLLSIALNIVHDKYDGEECLNDTYMDAWNKMPPERPDILKAFLSIIMRRTAVDRYRKNTRQKRIVSEYSLSFDDFGDYILGDDDTYSEVEVKELGNIISE